MGVIDPGSVQQTPAVAFEPVVIVVAVDSVVVLDSPCLYL